MIDLHRCWRRSPTRRSTIRSSSTNRNTTASARSRDRARARRVRLWSRLGNEKTQQFPEIADALGAVGAQRARKAPLVLDGEIVALDAKGEPTGFQHLQGRIHLAAPAVAHPAARPPSRSSSASVAFIAFDMLREGRTDLRDRPLTERRAALERVFGKHRLAAPAHQRVRSAATAARCTATRSSSGWEGLIAKHADRSTSRQADARLAQAEDRPRAGVRRRRLDRAAPDARVLRRAAARRLRRTPAGLGSTSATRHRLQRAGARARDEAARSRSKRQTCPFSERPKTNERPHWVRPELVAQIKFTEWTADGKLRHPVYLGLRDDKKAGRGPSRRPEVAVRRSSVAQARGRRAGPRTRTPTHAERSNRRSLSIS